LQTSTSPTNTSSTESKNYQDQQRYLANLLSPQPKSKEEPVISKPITPPPLIPKLTQDELDAFLEEMGKGQEFTKYANHKDKAERKLIFYKPTPMLGTLYWSELGLCFVFRFRFRVYAFFCLSFVWSPLLYVMFPIFSVVGSKKESSARSLLISDISTISLGKQTTAFTRPSAQKALSARCFSLQTDSRTLDLEANSQEARERWTAAIFTLCVEAGRHIRIDDGNKERRGSLFLFSFFCLSDFSPALFCFSFPDVHDWISLATVVAPSPSKVETKEPERKKQEVKVKPVDRKALGILLFLLPSVFE
jgi:hypothetical protein